MRRIRPALAGEMLEVGDLTLDATAHRVTRRGKSLTLGPTEFRLLRHFMEHPGRVFSRGQLLDAVWGNDSDIELRTVDVHIRRLRKGIELPDAPDPVRTVRSAGYALEPV
jgi:two-component system phosphate regulon response regulator PhoB